MTGEWVEASWVPIPFCILWVVACEFGHGYRMDLDLSDVSAFLIF